MNHFTTYDNFNNSSSTNDNIVINRKEDWPKCQFKLRVLAKQGGWEKYINNEDEHVYTETEVQSAYTDWQNANTNEDIHKLKAKYYKIYEEKKCIDTAISTLTMCVANNTTLAETLLNMTPFQIWRTLENKYKDDPRSKLNVLVDELTAITLETNEDPDVFFDKIEDLNNQIKKLNPKYAKSDEELVTMITQKIDKKKYDGPLTYIYNKQGENNVYDNVDEVKNQIRNYYIRNFRAEESENMKLISRGISAFQLSGHNEDVKHENKCSQNLGPNDRCVVKPVVNCGYCGKDNHVEADCRKKKRDNGEYKSQYYKDNKNENVKCFRCDKPGHYSKNCPKNKGKHFQDRQNEANENEINNIFVGMVMGSSKTPEPTEVDSAANTLVNMKVTTPNEQEILPGDGKVYKSNQVSREECPFCVDSLEHAYRLLCFAEDHSNPDQVQILPWHVVAEKENYAKVNQRLVTPDKMESKREGAISPINLTNAKECVCTHCNNKIVLEDHGKAHVNDNGEIPKLTASIQYVPKVFEMSTKQTDKPSKAKRCPDDYDDNNKKSKPPTEINLTITKSIGKTPQAIAETFEDTDEDSVDVLDDQTSVQVNNLEVHHVQGLLRDDNSPSSQSNPYSQRKDRKQDASNHFNQWILRNENECNDTVSDLISWSKQEFGDLDKGLEKLQNIETKVCNDDDTYRTRSQMNHTVKYLMEAYDPKGKGRVLDELPFDFEEEREEEERKIMDTYHACYYKAFHNPTDLNIHNLHKSFQVYMTYKHNRLLEYWSEEGKIVEGWLILLLLEQQNETLDWKDKTTKYWRFVSGELTDQEEDELKIKNEFDNTYVFDYFGRVKARHIYREVISRITGKFVNREDFEGKRSMLGLKDAEEDLLWDDDDIMFEVLKLDQLTDLQPTQLATQIFSQLPTQEELLEIESIATIENTTDDASDIETTFTTVIKDTSHNDKNLLNKVIITTNNQNVHYNDVSPSPSIQTEVSGVTSANNGELDSFSTRYPYYHERLQATKSNTKPNNTSSTTSRSPSYSSYSAFSDNTSVSTKTDLIPKQSEMDSDVSSLSYQYEPPPEYFNRPRLLQQDTKAKAPIMVNTVEAPTGNDTSRLPPKKRAMIDLTTDFEAEALSQSTTENKKIFCFVVSLTNGGVREKKNINEDLKDDEIEFWIADTGAGGHCASSNKKAKRYTIAKDDLTVANGSKTTVNGTMDLNLIVGRGTALELTDVKHATALKKNIISISALMKSGAKLHGDRDHLFLTYVKGNYEFKLNFKLSPYDGLYYLKAIRSETLPANYVILNPSTKSTSELHNIGVDSVATDINEWDNSTPKPLIDIDITRAHRQWGHSGEKLLRKIAKDNGYNLTGKLKECNGCGLVKAKAASVPRSTKRRATKVGERLFIDTTGPLPNTLGGNKYWTCAVDDYSNKTWVNFAKTKKSMLIFVKHIYEELKGKGHHVQYIRCDNAGEHLDDLRFFCHQHGIHLEYTAPYTPQLNGRVEQRIHVIWQRALTMMTDAGLKKETQKLLWAEAVNMAVFLYDLYPNWRTTKSAHEILTGEKASAWIPYLKEFGRIGLVTKRTKEGGKIEHLAHSCIMVGYSHNHPKGCYRLYNPETNKVIMSRDVKWKDFQPTKLRDQMGLFETEIGIEDSDFSTDITEPLSHHLRERVVCDLTSTPTDIPNSPSTTTTSTTSPVSSPPSIERNLQDYSPDVTKLHDIHIDPTTPNKITVKHRTSTPDTQSTRSSRSRSLTPIRRKSSVTFNNNPYIILDDDDEENIPTEKSRNLTPPPTNPIAPETTTEKGMTMRSGRQLLRVTGDTTAQRLNLLGNKQRSNSVHLVQDEGEEIQEINLQEALDNVGDHSITDPIISVNLVQFDTKSEILYDDNDDTDFVLTFDLSDQMLTPKTITEALRGPNKDLWKLASIAEVNNFLKRGSWKIVNKNDVLKQNRKLIGTKWVFKIKNEPDGSKRFKSRIVTLGYMQIPGIDYTERFSPVSTPSTIRIGLALVLYYTGWDAELIDIEAAFLEGRLKNPVYIKLPQGMVNLGFMTEQEYDTHCAELTAGMYGCVDAALQYFLRFSEYVTRTDGMNYTQSEVDPCVFYRKDQNGKLKGIIIAYVDDCICCGEKEEIDFVKNSLKKEFGTVEDGRLRKLLGIRYKWEEDENKERFVTMSMDDKAKEIVQAYENYAKKTINTFETPAVTGVVLENNEGKSIDEEDYRSIVGQIMFYATKISPEIANAIRNLSQHMINPGVQHWKALERLVGYIKGKEKHELILRRPKELRNYSYVDASFADCKDTRRSTGGDIHTLGGCITSWSSKRMKAVTLSSAEAEYVSLTDASKEMKFQQMLIDELTGEYEYPGIIYEDNQAAIFLTKNKQVSARTKHIDTREHYIRELVNENRIDVEYVKSNENFADIMTKNTPLTIFKPLTDEILKGMPKTQDKGYKRSLNELRRENVEEPSKLDNKSSKHVFVLHSNGTNDDVAQYNNERKRQTKKMKGNLEGDDDSIIYANKQNNYHECNSVKEEQMTILTPKNINEAQKDTLSSNYTYGITVENNGTLVVNPSTRETKEIKEKQKETSS